MSFTRSQPTRLSCIRCVHYQMGTRHLVGKTEACVFGEVRLHLLPLTSVFFELFQPLLIEQTESATRL